MKKQTLKSALFLSVFIILLFSFLPGLGQENNNKIKKGVTVKEIIKFSEGIYDQDKGMFRYIMIYQGKTDTLFSKNMLFVPFQNYVPKDTLKIINEEGKKSE